MILICWLLIILVWSLVKLVEYDVDHQTLNEIKDTQGVLKEDCEKNGKTL